MTPNGDDGFNQGAAFENEDAGILVDLRNVEEMSFEAIPKGIYPAVLDQCDYSLSKNSGKPMWSARFTIAEGEYANRKLFTFLSFSEKALPGTKRQIRQFAPELLSVPFDPKQVAESGALVGRPCRVKVDIEDYKPESGEVQKRNRIREIFGHTTAGDGFAG
jgi:hypothetical protein